MVWLLTIDWDGETIRRSTSPGSWGDVPWDGGLDDAQVTSALARAGANADPVVSLSITWPGVAERVAAGRNLSTATGELSVIPAGGTYETRLIVVTGSLSKPTFGGLTDPVAFTIRGDDDDNGALFPDPTHKLSTEAWDGCPDKGQQYPTVLGSPGFISTNEVIPATPAHYLKDGYWLIAGHHTSKDSKVTMFGEQAGAAVSFELGIEHDDDDLGRPISKVKAGDLDTGKPAFVGWGSSNGPAYGLHVNGEPLKTAGDVIPWMMAKSGATTGFELLRSELAAVSISGFIDAPVRPREWVEDNIVPLLPVSMAWTATGTRPVLRPSRPGPGPHLRVEAGLMVRKGVVTYDRPEKRVVNDHHFEWGWNVEENGTFKTTRTGGDLAPSWVRNSQLLHDARSGRSWSAFIYDAGSAAYVSSWQCRETAFSRRGIRYTVKATAQTLALVPGQEVTLTDAELHLVEVPGWVAKASWDIDGELDITVTLFDPREL